jgi:hypothetical protein
VDHDMTNLPLTNELFNIPIPTVRYTQGAATH